MMNIKEIETQIGFREIQIPKIFGENIRQFSATFVPNPILNLPIRSNYPGYSNKRLSEFLAGRICVLKALEGLVSRTDILPVGKNKMPIWPPGITGSITHTEDKVSAVVLPSNHNLSIGLDLENIFNNNIAEELEAEVLLGRERKYLKLNNYSKIITLIYSAKEAVFKAVNNFGFPFLDFKEIELTSLNFSANFFEAKLINSEKTRVKGKFAVLDSMVLTGAEINI